ncbi:MAG: alpha/beta hydrolase, partial [Acidimicrobiales bacterium]
MRKARVSRVLVALVVVAVGTTFAACRTDDPTTGGPTTTTTTLPQSVGVTSSGVGGPFAAVGQVYRVAVGRLGRNRIAPRVDKGQFVAPTVLVAYRQFGSGPNLLLISGEHSTMTSWDPRFLLALAAHYTVTEFDFPDVGFSAPDARYTSVTALADYTAGLVWALGLERPTVLGWGFGGEVALSLVERHPGLIWRLVLADATAGGALSTPPATDVAQSLASPVETPTELSYLFYPLGAASSRATWLSDSSKVTADVMTAAAVLHEANVVANGYSSDRVEKSLGQVGIPTLVFAGGEDDVVPAQNADLLAALIPHAQFDLFPHGGYATLFEEAPA